MVNGYFDASGTEAEGPVVVVVGAFAEQQDWEAFDAAWLEEMNRDFGVSSFHMKHFAHFQGAFEHGWREDPEKRARFLERLIDYATRTVYRHYVTTMVLDDYRRVDGERKLTETIGGPYSYAQWNCIFNALEWLSEEHGSEQGHMFIERGDIGQDAFMRVLREMFPHFVDHVHPIYKKDENGHDITPFHIPDFIGYEYRREHGAYIDTGAPSEHYRKSLGAIRRTLYPKVGIVQESNIRDMCDLLNIPLR